MLESAVASYVHSVATATLLANPSVATRRQRPDDRAGLEKIKDDNLGCSCAVRRLFRCIRTDRASCLLNT